MEARSLSKMSLINEEKLILLVSQYPEIYDVQHDNYMNSSRKKQLWSEIAEEMGVNGKYLNLVFFLLWMKASASPMYK